ncbi:complexin-like [Stegodyphus dumicola]|nr:complexin-like [Stegodyphus dumicola]
MVLTPDMLLLIPDQFFTSIFISPGAVGTEEEGTSEDKDAADEEEQERLEALREAEERRKEKHRKMEEEREKMRQEIRDKYGIKKKEEVQQEDPFADMEGSSLNRKRKTPAELAAEAEAEEQDEFTKLKNSLETQVSELKSSIEGKCLLQ